MDVVGVSLVARGAAAATVNAAYCDAASATRLHQAVIASGGRLKRLSVTVRATMTTPAALALGAAVHRAAAGGLEGLALDLGYVDGVAAAALAGAVAAGDIADITLASSADDAWAVPILLAATALATLTLRMGVLADETCAAVAAVMAAAPDLRSVDLSGCAVTPRAAAMLAWVAAGRGIALALDAGAAVAAETEDETDLVDLVDLFSNDDEKDLDLRCWAAPVLAPSFT